MLPYSDEMGLGKTVQVLATMTMHMPADEVSRTTLIIVPAALLQQVCNLPILPIILCRFDVMPSQVEGRNRNKDQWYLQRARSSRQG
jgi:hypothetical protein